MIRKTFEHEIQQVKDEVHDNASIIKIDVDKNQHTAATYQVNSVPTLMLFKQGKVLWRQSGVSSKTDLVKKIKEHF